MDKSFILVGYRIIDYKSKTDNQKHSFVKCTIVDNDSNILVCNVFKYNNDFVDKLGKLLLCDITDFCSYVYDEKTMSYRVIINL